MPMREWRSRAKRARDASVREQEALLDALGDNEVLTESDLRIYRQVDPGYLSSQSSFQAYPYRFGGDPFPYYRYTPYFFGGSGQAAAQPPPVSGPSQQSSKSVGKKGDKQSSQKKIQVTQKAGNPDTARNDGSQIPHGYCYYPYPPPYSYAGNYGYASPQPYPYAQHPHQYGQQPPYPGHYPAAPDLNQSDDDASTAKTGLLTIEGRRPLFLVALFVVSIAVLLVSFPLTLLSAGYIGPLGLMFATGPFATVFAFWAIYLTPCECYPNIEWATSRIRVFATTAAVFDAVGTVGVPISMYGAQCPDDDDTMLGCEDELPAAKGVSLAVAVVLGTHCFLCLLVRSNARKLAESKFGDSRTEGITLTPTPLDRA